MAKFCVLARKVTNCTENCRECLEEETNDREIEVGDKVRYIAEDSIEDKESGYYPPKGTIGEVGKSTLFISSITRFWITAGISSRSGLIALKVPSSLYSAS